MTEPDPPVDTTDPTEPDLSPATVEDLLDLAVSELGGVAREGQQRMARAIADSLDARSHLLVQAGTGTGKSLGYLVPAIAHAVTSDERVLVSTATLALQRQVITRDLPLVAKALAPALPRPARVALLKGWANYLCAHKVEGGYPPEESATLFEIETPGGQVPAEEHPAPDPAPGSGSRSGGWNTKSSANSLGEEVVRLREWAESTPTGDRDDLVPGVSERAWRQVSVTSLECIGQRCPKLRECFPEQARTTAREADVVVTNHAMLGIAASGNPNVLPEHDVLIVDEAHELTSRVTSQATAELSAISIEIAARHARRHGGLPTTDLDAAAASLGAALMDLPEGRFAHGLPEQVALAVAAVRDAARDLVSDLKPAAGDKSAPLDSGLKIAQANMNILFEIAERMSADATGHDVLWSSRQTGESDRRGSGITRLFIAPLNVSGLVRTHLLADRSGIFTSATLSLGGTFEPIARSLGLEGPREAARGGGPSPGATGPSGPPVPPGPSGSVRSSGTTAASGTTTVPAHRADTLGLAEPRAALRPWKGLDVGTPFEYAAQGILYIAKHLPAPGREAATDDQLDEIAELITAAGGRTLGLFSSRRAANAVAEAMRERLDVPILCQGDDQLPTLVKEFAADPATCLFGTLSLWQGVDVPGPTCQLVLIDRIPFPRPDDPISSARTEAVAASGGNGFMQVSATHAALLLAQGAGRLIRTSTDRGVVAVLDPRLSMARYGSYLTRSMPGLWPTTDRDTVTAALRRLAAH